MRFAFLADNPEAGRLRTDIGFKIRTFPVYDYIIYYQPENRNRILVVRIVHGMRDQRKALGEV